MRLGVLATIGKDWKLRERAALGADLQMVYMPRGDVASTAKQLEALIS